jgi:uncharacterized protein (DUF302 family)
MDRMSGDGRPEGLDAFRSADGMDATVARLEAALAREGLTVFARIDHGGAARAVGLPLPRTLVFVIGAAAAGTPLMAQRPWLAIDLPLRLLVWEPRRGGPAEVGVNDPAWIVARHGLASDLPQVVGMRKALSTIVAAATGART